MNPKKALVTGASEGIGREFAIQLSQQGYQLKVVARNGSRLKELVDELGEGHSYLVADLSEPKDLNLVKEALQNTHFDLLVNNAGFGVYGPFHDTPCASYDQMVALNIGALMHLSHVFLKKAQKGDALLNVSSTLAMVPFPNNAVYAATKAFVTSFTESLWYENRDRGVFVMGLNPGVTKTNFHERAGGSDENLPPEMISQTAEEVARSAIRSLHKRRRPTLITGAPNKALAAFARLLPRSTMVNMIGEFMSKKTEKTTTSEIQS